MSRYLFLVGLGSVLVLGCQKERDAVDVAALKKDIQTHLPAGTPKADVIAFLDQRKIAHECLQTVVYGSNGVTVIQDSHTEVCLIPDIRTEGWLWNATSESLYIRFRFGTNDSKLISCTYQEAYKGL